jgi:hypothetical protein
MGEVKYPTNAEVVIDELKDVQTFKESEIGTSVKDFNNYGIVIFPTGTAPLQSKNFTITYNTGTIPNTFNVGQGMGSATGGVAVDSSGRRIVIDSDVAWQSTTFTPPSGESAVDPYGQPLLRVSGNYNIPLVPPVSGGYVNYVYIKYSQVVDPAKTVIDEQDIPVTWYTNYKDGYKIIVLDGSTGAPSIPADSLFLGIITADSSGVISAVDEAGSLAPNIRIYAQQRPATVAITTPTDDTDVTATYTYNSTYTLDKHIKAKGSATISATNPHGISAADLGIFPSDTVGGHQQYFHSSGIVNGDIASTTSSLYPYLDAGNTVLKIRPLSPTEKLAVTGVTYGSTSPVTYHGISGDTTVTFATEYTTGTFSGSSVPYYFYIDISVPTVPVLTFSSSLPAGDNYYIICSVSWNGVVLSALTDYRIFWNHKPMSIWPIQSRRNITGQFGYNKYLNAVEYFNGTDWIALNFEYHDVSTHTGSTTYAIQHGLLAAPERAIITLWSTGTARITSVDATNINVATSAGSVEFKVYAKRIIVT